MNQDVAWLLKEKYNGEKSAAFFADCERLRNGEPLAYIIGYVPFLNCRIYLDSRPLIPRPETEFWVAKAIATIQSKQTSDSARIPVLDLCAGSGAIGVAVAAAIPEVDVTFGELASQHLPTIGKNLQENNIPCTRYCVFVSDVFNNIHATYEYIFCNPPYIDPALDRTELSVRTFEPGLALYGGDGGTEIIEQIISAAPSYLTPSGELWIEHEPEQTARIALVAKEHFTVSHHHDQYNVVRYSILRRHQ